MRKIMLLFTLMYYIIETHKILEEKTLISLIKLYLVKVVNFCKLCLNRYITGSR